MNSKTALILRDWAYIRCKPDLKIVGKSGHYLCHRIVILCLSPYFQKLFQYKQQSSDGLYIVDMSDIETLSLLSIINFAYKSVIDINEENVEHLMISADKYNILSIMNRCQQFLWHRLSADNCFEAYLLSHFYNCHRLKANIKRYIVDNRLIDGWKAGLSQSNITHEDIETEWQRRSDRNDRTDSSEKE